eukprot:CAMPEP_0206584108 /NCGR_PEP_ID=MMETSP0325_2-20121206/35514_1 /ASSEMBLY_ACC=CAM_ASM_000347 /TAXON_ID=2866 /ORGANISM="Crypthecodinium cohnii, Strain Seligo" /LENGTH=118 /DNA_ID=CAMNT_0054091179 /DNA_START=134 /DNA_END=487 /DNA_ORIENTATION=-
MQAPDFVHLCPTVKLSGARSGSPAGSRAPRDGCIRQRTIHKKVATSIAVALARSCPILSEVEVSEDEAPLGAVLDAVQHLRGVHPLAIDLDDVVLRSDGLLGMVAIVARYEPGLFDLL